MDEIKPIKRSPELTPLSKDHHEGLLLVWKIRQGIRNGTSLQAIQDYIEWFWANHLEKHFHDEEVLLVPVLGTDHPMIVQMMDEHQLIKNSRDEMRDEEKLERWASLLNDHIRFEERKLFPLIEEKASAEELQKISVALADEKTECLPWENEFWLKK